jgi:hypothetical protein
LLLLAPNRGNNGTLEFSWRGLELIVGNYYVLTLLVFIAATACALVLTRRIRPERAVGPPSPMPCRRHGRPASPGRAISFLNGRRWHAVLTVRTYATRRGEEKKQSITRPRPRVLGLRGWIKALAAQEQPDAEVQLSQIGRRAMILTRL